MTNSLLHIIGMICMLTDHNWAVLFPWNEMMSLIGRIAFPIFAFLCAEGYRKTSSFKKYALRMFIFALISEVPFDLMSNGVVFYPFHQNVMFTFLVGLFMMKTMDIIKDKYDGFVRYILMVLSLALFYVLGIATFADYYGNGILMIFVFYIFKDRSLISMTGQFIFMYYINVVLMGGYYYPVTIGGHYFEIMRQGFGLLAMPFIYLYNGKKGNKTKAFQYFCYAFYPLHMIIIYFVFKMTFQGGTMIWLIMCVAIALLIIFDGLLVIFVWNTMCSKEAKGKEFGRYANGFMFRVNIKEYKIKRHSLLVKGTYSGRKPSFNNLIHIYSGEEEYIGLCRSAKTEDDNITLKVYVPKKMNLTEIDEVSTIRRKYRNISDETKYVEYPFKLKKRFVDCLIPLVLFATGLLFIAAAVYSKEKAVLSAIMGILFILLGGYMFIDAVKSSVTFINSDHYLIDSGFSLKEYRIEDLVYDVSKDDNGKLMLSVYEKGEQKKLVYFHEQDKHFFDAINVFNYSREKSIYLNKYVPLFDKEVYALFSERDNIIYYQTEDEYRIVYAYADKDKLNTEEVSDCHIELHTVEEIIKRISEFDGVDLLIICNEDGKPVDINKTVYEKMLKYRDYLG